MKPPPGCARHPVSNTAACHAADDVVEKGSSKIILHFDYDCFYASVFENENPALKSVPLAVQQKQIIVTCNYEARRRGLRKLQLIAEAKKILPDVVIVLGEELGRFRDASKALYKFLEAFTWSGRVERLGFDEVFMDVTDIIDYNQTLLNPNNLANSFFQMKRDDPTLGFSFDATRIAGHGYPTTPPSEKPSPQTLSLITSTHDEVDLNRRLILGSHFAQHLRLSLEEDQGYTSTVGISTNKLLSKLVGNTNKPKAQTTLLPPYIAGSYGVDENDQQITESNLTKFIDDHEIGKIPGLGFKMCHRIRNHVLSKASEFNGFSYNGIVDSVAVREVRLFTGMGPEMLEKILGGPGAERGIGAKAWGLINGIDDTEVQQAKKMPSQISIEDSYIRLDSISHVVQELRILSTSLIKRMHVDLLEDDEKTELGTARRWIAHPKTIRLTTRPRLRQNSDGTRARSSTNRISRSGPLPNFMFNLAEDVNSIVERLVQETLIPMFRRLHPHRGWNLSLVNICVTNMVEAASDDGTGGGRDIGRMFKRQEDVLKEWRIEDRDVPPDPPPREDGRETCDETFAEPSAGNDALDHVMNGSEDVIYPTQQSVDDEVQWEVDGNDGAGHETCHECGAVMPAFAIAAHERYHSFEA